MATREGRAKTKSKSPDSAVRGRQAPQKRKFPLIPIVVGAAVVLLALGVAYATGVFNGGLTGEVAATSPGGPVEVMPSRQHLPDGQAVEYSTNPPTSGDHWQQPATWGIYPSTPPPDERLVHNLEHGGVVIYYNPTKIQGQDLELLKELTRDLRRTRVCLLLTQRPNMPEDKALALTAWGALATLDSFDEGAIRAFWRDYVAKGPELGMGQCG